MAIGLEFPFLLLGVIGTASLGLFGIGFIPRQPLEKIVHKLVGENQQMQTGQGMVFTIEDRFVPYVRMTQRSKWVNRQAQRYLNSQAYLRCQFSQQMQASAYTMIPPQTPFSTQIEIEMPSRLHCQDLDNQEKALIDAAQSVVFPDDRWLDAKISVRRIGPESRVVIWFWIISQQNGSGPANSELLRDSRR